MGRLQEKWKEGCGSDFLLKFPSLFLFCKTGVSAFPVHELSCWAICGWDSDGLLG